jgi:hypothetical protein
MVRNYKLYIFLKKYFLNSFIVRIDFLAPCMHAATQPLLCMACGIFIMPGVRQFSPNNTGFKNKLYRLSSRRLSAKFVPNFVGRGVSRGQPNWSPRPLISGFKTAASNFHSSSSTFILARLSGPRSRPTTSQRMWWGRELNPGPAEL